MIFALIALAATLQSEPLTAQNLSGVSRFATPIAKKVTIPFFLSADDKASAVLRLERVSRDLQRKGFFRVALLPHVVFENAELKIFDRNAAIDAISAIRSQLKHLSKNRALVVNGLSLIISDGERMELTASGVSFNDDNTISLRNLCVEIGQQKHFADAGVLQLAGEKRGHLVLSMEKGTKELDLFTSRNTQ